MDYRDSLSEEECQQILNGKLYEVQDNIYERNIDYIFELENQQVENLKEKFEELKDFDNMDIRDEFLDYLTVNLNFNDLLKNSSMTLRITLHSNYEGINYAERWDNEYLEQLKESNIYQQFTVKSMKQEVENICSCVNQLVFVGQVNMDDLVNELYKDGELKKWSTITIKEGIAGFFDSWNGSGSVLELEYKKPITLKKQWHNSKYDNVDLRNDKGGYGVKEVYGMSVNDLVFTVE